MHGISTLTVRIKECSVEGAETQSIAQMMKKNFSPFLTVYAQKGVLLPLHKINFSHRFLKLFLS